MACRCQQRRDALRRAAQAKTVKEVREEAAFVGRTMVEDAKAALFRRFPRKQGKG